MSMPFVGEMSGKRVIPEEVSDGTDVACPFCEGVMRPRGPFADGTARHFYHLNDSTGCSGGESNKHRKLKSLAVSGLRSKFTDQVAKLGPEIRIDVSGTNSRVNERYADALVRFDPVHEFYGSGLAIEVQYRNRGKDIEATTHDYLNNGISVFWADADDFEQDRFLMENLIQEFEAVRSSTVAYLTGTDTPPPVSDGTSIDGGRTTSVDEHRWTPIDPVPGCRHEIIPASNGPGPTTYRCVRCGIELQYRVYSEGKQKYVQVKRHWSTGSEFVVDTSTVENEYVPPEILEEGTPEQSHYHEWGAGSKFEGYTRYRCSCGAEMVVRDTQIFIDHKSLEQDDECDHDWEIKGTFKFCTKCDEERRPWDE